MDVSKHFIQSHPQHLFCNLAIFTFTRRFFVTLRLSFCLSDSSFMRKLLRASSLKFYRRCRPIFLQGTLTKFWKLFDPDEIRLGLCPLGVLVTWFKTFVQGWIKHYANEAAVEGLQFVSGLEKTRFLEKVFKFLGCNLRRPDTKLWPINSQRISHARYTLLPAT